MHYMWQASHHQDYAGDRLLALLPAVLGAKSMLDIIDLADKATRCTLGRGRGWTTEDWQDAKQEAAAALISLPADKGEGYAFLVAKSAIYTWLRAWLRHPRGGTILDYLDYAAEPESLRAPVFLPELLPLLRSQGSLKADEETRYLELRLAGYSTDGVALEMGLSRRRVYAIRERLLPRLDRIARGIVPPTRGEAIKAGRAAAQCQ